jgi:hypothetical protein
METKNSWSILDNTNINGKILCKCVCGKEKMVNINNLKRGLTTSCGCIKNKPLCDLTNYKGVIIGDKYNKLTIIDIPFRKKIKNGNNKLNSVIHVKCRCDCGSIVERRLRDVMNKNILGCGCTDLGQKMIGKLPRYFYRYLMVQAKQREIPFTLTFEELSKLFDVQNNKCALSDVYLKFNSSSKILDGNASLDRIDSNKPYETGNVQWVDVNINYAKLRLSNDEFIQMCKNVTKKFS